MNIKLTGPASTNGFGFTETGGEFLVQSGAIEGSASAMPSAGEAQGAVPSGGKSHVGQFSSAARDGGLAVKLNPDSLFPDYTLAVSSDDVFGTLGPLFGTPVGGHVAQSWKPVSAWPEHVGQSAVDEEVLFYFFLC